MTRGLARDLGERGITANVGTGRSRHRRETLVVLPPLPEM